MLCILAECWMTRSNKLAKERTWHPALAWEQIDAAPTPGSLLLNNRQTSPIHTMDTRETKNKIQLNNTLLNKIDIEKNRVSHNLQHTF